MTGKIDCPKATDNVSDLLWSCGPIAIGIAWIVGWLWVAAHFIIKYW
jgi:hypothetical protein